MRPPFKPEVAYLKFADIAGTSLTFAYMRPSIRDYMSNTMYGPGHAEKAYQAQVAHSYLILLLVKLGVRGFKTQIV